MVPAYKIILNNGHEMAAIGLGTYKSTEEEGIAAIKTAIDAGYRHIDTAYAYQNEKEVGRAIREKISDGSVKREDIFLVTKLANNFHDIEKVEAGCRLSLKNLGLDYIDLYLMHAPFSNVYVSDKEIQPKENGKVLANNVDYLDTWKEMEKLVEKGLVRSLGVSNYNSDQIERLVKNSNIKPVTNQVECHPEFNQKKLIEFCKQYDIILTAYCPLARPNPQLKTPKYFFDEKIHKIGAKYDKTPAQIALRYLLQIGTVPIPKSSSPERIRENLQIFDFELTDEDVKIIDSFNCNNRTVKFTDFTDHEFFPFDIEF